MKKNSGHYSVGMIAAVLIGLSAVCPFASIQAAPSATQDHNVNPSPSYEATSLVSSSEPTNQNQDGNQGQIEATTVSPSPGNSSASPPAQEQGVPTDVKRVSTDTVQSLSTQPSFAQWKDAEISYHPLGPGTHSWLVQVNRAGEYIGYLIIGADHNGAYQLNEYGNGPGGPYSMNLLRQSLKSLTETKLSSIDKLQITPMYEEPLLAYWLVRSSTGSEVCIDAFTGDPLPAEVANGNWKNKLHSSTIPLPALSLKAEPQAITLSAEPFDPYDDLSWLLPKQKLFIHNVQQFTNTLSESSRIVFSATDINFAFGGPLAINGYQSWNPSHGLSHPIMYAVTCRTELSRFVPLDQLLSGGGFYRMHS
ncbi:hypothetical protein [Paenibacillus terrae]|uniref:Uncharacterized protein n=1 Tax=Paenibacillus terrae TaxID=159743 RepID=A0A0D7X0P4_9BACL|nr:hypothetical protein [Paenibacillus terrae]KJD44769.1 hypothetical protein QD47_15500 [Paenibacillus terrae]